MCVMCYELGLYVPAKVVDHIVKVKDDPDLAFEGSNLQSLCKHCHDSHKQAMEKSGKIHGTKQDGTPMDPSSHWK